MDIFGTTGHQGRVLEQVEETAAEHRRLLELTSAARDARDAAFRRAWAAGLKGRQIAEVAQVSSSVVDRARYSQRGGRA